MEPHANNTKPTGTGPWVFRSASGALVLALVGCRAGPKNFDNENDALRREVSTLKAEVSRLSAENTDLRAKADQALAAMKASGTPGAAVIESMPRCAALELSSKTALARSGPPQVEVVIETLDARRRFVQVAGTLRVDATSLPQDANGTPQTIGVVTLTPEMLREAYRSSFMGTHYAVTLDLSAPPSGTLVVRARLDDAVTAQTLEATRTLTGR